MSPAACELLISLNRIPEAGMELAGEIASTVLGLPESDRAWFPHPVFFEFKLSRVQGKLLVQGGARTRFRARCDGCLAEFEAVLETSDMCHYFADEENDEIDLTNPLREDILLDFPQRLLCAASCAGLCATCGANLNLGACGCSEAVSEGNPWRELDGFEAE